jgi:GNAT superfamily N-acetyltransferase
MDKPCYDEGRHNTDKEAICVEIRKLEIGDLRNALDLVWDVFAEFEAPDYSAEGIAEFKKFIAYDSMSKKVSEGEILFWGYFDRGNLAGLIAMRDIGHICLLFVRKEYQLQGIAKELFKTVEDMLSREDVPRITVNSSPYAVEIYHRLGFVDLDQEQTINGIRFTPMVYLVT